MVDIAEILSNMKSLHLTLATAESCTGGGVAAAIAAIPGASDVLQGGVVAYQSRVKAEVLNVNADDIERYDVVSEPVVKQMVKGACQRIGADIALATTGYAGPSSGNPDIPVGTIWIGCGSPDNIITKCLTLDGDRKNNVQHAIEQVLGLLANYLSLNFS